MKRGKRKRQEQEASVAVAQKVKVKKEAPSNLSINKITIGKSNRFKILAVCLLVFIVAFLAYANTLKSDFIWDDEYLILNNSQIKTFAHIKNIFKTYVGYGSENINNFYRPMQELSNMIDYFLWGKYPLGFHLTNVLFHAFVALMLFLFVYYLVGNIFAAGVTALLWAVHPVHTEAIAYIAGRADSLYSLFMLLSLVLFIRFTNKARTGNNGNLLYAFSILSFIVAILSKEIAIMTPIFVFMYMFFFLKGTKYNNFYKKIKFYWIPYAAVSAFYAFLRSTVLSFSDIAPGSAFAKIPMIYRLTTFFRVLLTYFRLMVFPTGLHMERSIRISKSLFEPLSILAFILIAAILWAAVKMYKRNRLVSFAIVWFFVNLFPMSNIVPINSFIAEHWIYMASIGPFMLVGLGAAWVNGDLIKNNIQGKAAFIVCIAVVLGFYFRGTVVRNLDWKDEISFFKSTLKYHPKNARLYLNLGNTYYENKDIHKAIEQYEKAIEINKNYAVAYGNIGSAHLNLKDPVKAEEYLLKAISIKDNYPIAHYNLGIIYFNKNNYPAAIKELDKATDQLPQLFQAWNMKGRTYLKIQQPAKGKECFRRSLETMPNQPSIRRVFDKL